MTDNTTQCPPTCNAGGYNNCHIAGSMTEAQRNRAMEKYYNSLPMTKEKEEWLAMFSPTVDVAKPKKTKKAARKRKPNPQPKITKVFEHKRNKDGYEMRFCKYQPEVGDFVYVPPGYGAISAKKRSSCNFCLHCQLAPCLTQEYLGETHDKAVRLELYSNKEPPEIRQIVSEDLQRKHCKFFKRRFLRRTKPQRCIEKYVNDWFPDNSDHSDDESQPDLFLEVLRNREIGDRPSI